MSGGVNVCETCMSTLRAGKEIHCASCATRLYGGGETTNKRGAGAASASAGGGDRIYHWQCAVCHQTLGMPETEFQGSENLKHIMHSLSKKFEVVNKIQIPKLNKDLMQVKTISDRIIKQNEVILHKLSEIENNKNVLERDCKILKSTRYRTRKVNLKSKTIVNEDEEKENVAILPEHAHAPSTLQATHGKRSKISYRRRRSYIFCKMIHVLNKKLSRNAQVSRKMNC